MMTFGIALFYVAVVMLGMHFLDSMVGPLSDVWMHVAFIFGAFICIAARESFEWAECRSQRSTLMPDGWADLQRLRSVPLPFPLPDGITEQQEYILRKFAENERSDKLVFNHGLRVYKYDGKFHREREYPYILDATEPIPEPHAYRTLPSMEPKPTEGTQPKK